MTRPFRFGVQLTALDDADALRASARQIESLGYDELFSFDHIGTVDPFVPLMVAAEATTTLRIGPLVLNNEFHHPALLARTAATVDRLTGGRLVLGMGTGYMQSEHDAIGLELRAPGPRVSRFEESLVALRALLDEQSHHRVGQHHQLALDELGVAPVQQRVPLLIGGHGRRVVGIAGRHADIFQYTGLTHGEGGVPGPGGFPLDHVMERSRWLADAAGERNESIERSVLVQVTDVDGDADETMTALAERWGIDADEVAASPFALVGSVEQIVDELERRRETLGVSHVVIRDIEGFAPVVDALAGR